MNRPATLRIVLLAFAFVAYTTTFAVAQHGGHGGGGGFHGGGGGFHGGGGGGFHGGGGSLHGGGGSFGGGHSFNGGFGNRGFGGGFRGGHGWYGGRAGWYGGRGGWYGRGWGGPYWGGYWGYPGWGWNWGWGLGFGYAPYWGYGYGYPYGYGYYPSYPEDDYSYNPPDDPQDDPPADEAPAPRGGWVPNVRTTPRYPDPRRDDRYVAQRATPPAVGYRADATERRFSSMRPAVRNVLEALQNMPPDARERQIASGRYRSLSAKELKLVRSEAGVPAGGR